VHGKTTDGDFIFIKDPHFPLLAFTRTDLHSVFNSSSLVLEQFLCELVSPSMQLVPSLIYLDSITLVQHVITAFSTIEILFTKKSLHNTYNREYKLYERERERKNGK